MEKEIQQLQYMITQNDEDAFFRELEAERFKSRLHLASFQYSKSPFPWGYFHKWSSLPDLTRADLELSK